MNTYEIYPIKVSCFMMKNYTYLIVDKWSNHAFIVDPSWEPTTIQDKIEALELEIKGILLTHSHYDHVNLVKHFQTRYNCNVYITKEESEFYHYTCSHQVFIEDLDEIVLGRTTITTILTPGHTAGSCCYLLSNSLITGDTVFIEGVGMCQSKGASAEKMYDSVQRLKKMIRPDVKIYPGHSYGEKPGISFSVMKQKNIYFQITDKESFVKFRMRKNQSNLFNFK